MSQRLKVKVSEIKFYKLRKFVEQAPKDYPLKERSPKLYGRKIALRIRVLCSALQKSPNGGHWSDYAAVVLVAQTYSRFMSERDAKKLVDKVLSALSKLIDRIDSRLTWETVERCFSGYGRNWIEQFGDKKQISQWERLATRFRKHKKIY